LSTKSIKRFPYRNITPKEGALTMAIVIGNTEFKTTVKTVDRDNGIAKVVIMGRSLNNKQNITHKVNVEVRSLFDLLRLEKERKKRQETVGITEK